MSEAWVCRHDGQKSVRGSTTLIHFSGNVGWLCDRCKEDGANARTDKLMDWYGSIHDRLFEIVQWMKSR